MNNLSGQSADVRAPMAANFGLIGICRKSDRTNLRPSERRDDVTREVLPTPEVD